MHARKPSIAVLVMLCVCALLRPAPAASPTAAATPASAAPLNVTTRVEPQTVTIGTPFRYTMRIESDPNVELVIPLLVDRIGEFTITDFGELPARTEKGRVVVERWYTLVSFAAGDQIVPGPTVQYRTPGSDLLRIDAPDALVIVESVLAKSANATDIRDIQGPVALPRDYRPLIALAAAAAGVLALAAGAYFLLSRRRRRVQAPPPPPHEIALHALERLRAERLLEAGQHKEYYVRLSNVVRAYLEARFRLRAPEMTTEEFLQEAQRNPQLAAAHRSALSQFLNEADLVKFARYMPSLEDAERAYRAARGFVESTRPPLEVPRAAA